MLVILFFNNIFMQKLQNKKGFTLIELLVVITIIGILATGATATYTSQIQKARDTTRVNDIKALQAWVEQSYNDVSEYPKWSTLQAELIKYMWKLPADSKQGQPCSDWWTAANATDCAYAYISWPDNNSILFWEYELSTGFENKWNVTSKAATDWWTADAWWNARLEIWIDVANNSTAVAKDSIASTATKWVVKSTWSAAADSGDDTLVVIINWN